MLKTNVELAERGCDVLFFFQVRVFCFVLFFSQKEREGFCQYRARRFFGGLSLSERLSETYNARHASNYGSTLLPLLRENERSKTITTFLREFNALNPLRAKVDISPQPKLN